MSTAVLIEVLSGGSAKYQLSPPWKSRRSIVVAPMTLLDGKALTYVYTDNGKGNTTILDTLAGHPSHQQVLDHFGYRLT